VALSDEYLRSIADETDPVILRSLSDEDRKRLEQFQTGEVEQEQAGVPSVFLKRGSQGKRLGLTQEGKKEVSPRKGFGVFAPSFSAAGETPVPSEVELEAAESLALIAPAAAVGIAEGIRGTEVTLDDISKAAGATLEFTRRSITPGNPEFGQLGWGIVKSPSVLIPGTPYNQAVAQIAEDEADFVGDFFANPRKTAEEHPFRTLLIPLDLLGVGGLIYKAGKPFVRYAGKRMALAEYAESQKAAMSRISKEAEKIVKKAAKHNVEVSHQKAVELLIKSETGLDELLPTVEGVPMRRVLPVDPKSPTSGLAAESVPRLQGQELAWSHEAGKKGPVAYQELRDRQGKLAYAYRMVSKENQAKFKNLDRADQNEVAFILQGVGRSAGKPVWGGISRAGEVEIPKGVDRIAWLKEHSPGTRYIEPQTGEWGGRFYGSPADEMFQTGSPDQVQLYRAVLPEHAEAAYKDFVKRHPKTKLEIDEFIAEIEDPIWYVTGDRKPPTSRVASKAFFEIKGLEEDANLLTSWAEKAYGPEWGKFGKLEMRYVPEQVDIGYHPANPKMRFRHALMPKRAKVRMKKTGVFAEAALAGEVERAPFSFALTNAQHQLMKEASTNDVVSTIITLLAKPIRAGETMQSILAEGMRPLSKTGLWEESRKLQRFFSQSEEHFKRIGVDFLDEAALETIRKGTYTAGGRGYKIPQKIVAELEDEFFTKKPLSTDIARRERWEKFDAAMGDLLNIPLTGWLTMLPTANRNALTSGVMQAVKTIRDFYKGVFRFVDGEVGDLPFQDFASDLKAFRLWHGKDVRKGIPPEVLTPTFMQEVQAGAGATAIGRTINPAMARMLKMTGFQYWDILPKRITMAATQDAWAAREWNVARAANKTGGLTKKEFKARKLQQIPPEVRNSAIREFDTFGSYDYGNVPTRLAKWKKHNAGRGTIAYTTYFYKLTNTYREMFNPLNIRDMWNPFVSSERRVGAGATVLATSTIFGVLWNLIDDVGNFSDEIKDKTIRELTEIAEGKRGKEFTELELPIQQRKFGRVEVAIPERAKVALGMLEDDSIHARTYDLPIVGEIQLAKAIHGKSYELSQFLNDRLSLGPLGVAAQHIFDMNDQWTEDVPRAAQVGRSVFSVLPFSRQLQAAERLIQPEEAEYFREDAPPWQNLVASLAVDAPFLSELLADPDKHMLDPRTRQSDLSVKVRPRAHTLTSSMLLNIHVHNQNERQQALNLAAEAFARDTDQQYDEDRVRDLIVFSANEEGKTAAGQAKRAIAADSFVVTRKMRRYKNKWEITRAFDAAGGDFDAALARARQLFPEMRRDPGEVQSALNLLLKLWFEEHGGLAGREFVKTPEMFKAEFLQQIQQFEKPPKSELESQ
jgi:hypothetical protein